jgi:hypothetical protein
MDEEFCILRAGGGQSLRMAENQEKIRQNRLDLRGRKRQAVVPNHTM